MELRVPRQVLVYVHRLGEGGERQFLLLRRMPDRGGFWQGISGAPEAGESDRDAAVREVREETGFDVGGSLEPVDFRYELRPHEGNRSEWLRLYGPGVDVVPEEVYAASVGSDEEPTLASEEHDAYRWCSLGEALGLLFWPDNRDALVATDAQVPRQRR